MVADLDRKGPVSAAKASWRPVDASDDMALIARALEILLAVIHRAAARSNEDADALILVSIWCAQ